jgi:hypothetical protein
LLGGQAAAIVAGLRVDFNRYYLPIVLFVALCIGFFAGEVTRAVARWLTERQAARGHTGQSQSGSDFGTPMPVPQEPR